jgi:hypothetical protein
LDRAKWIRLEPLSVVENVPGVRPRYWFFGAAPASEGRRSRKKRKKMCDPTVGQHALDVLGSGGGKRNPGVLALGPPKIGADDMPCISSEWPANCGDRSMHFFSVSAFAPDR